MSTTIRKRKPARRSVGRKNGSDSPPSAEFPAGSLEAALSAIGQAATATEWAKIPADYFANLDCYLHETPEEK